MTQDSGTPRTDAAEEINSLDWHQNHSYDGRKVVPADFARQLERELSQSRAEAERLRAALQLVAQVLRDTQLIGDDQRAGEFFCCECARHFDDPDKPEHEPQCPVGRALETARLALDRQESSG